MYDDYDLDYTFAQDCTYDLDEAYDNYMSRMHLDVQDMYDMDDEYARDSQDYATLAYTHYA